jgi:hypothetical protein
VVAEDSWRQQISAARNARAGLGPASLVLYDCSTLYFETDQGDGFPESGFSKERRLEAMNGGNSMDEVIGVILAAHRGLTADQVEDADGPLPSGLTPEVLGRHSWGLRSWCRCRFAASCAVTAGLTGNLAAWHVIARLAGIPEIEPGRCDIINLVTPEGIQFLLAQPRPGCPVCR